MITVVTLYDDASGNTWIGAISGTLSEDYKKEIADLHNAFIDGEPGSHEEEGRTISFTVIEDGDTTLYNIWKS